MSDTARSEGWRVLCELASKEKDPEKLMDLIAKINRVLEAGQENRHTCVDASVSSHGVAPQLSSQAESES